MSRQLAFSSTISVMITALFALSATIRAEAAPGPVSQAQVAAVSDR